MILSTGKIIYTHLQFSAESEFSEMAKKHTNGKKKITILHTVLLGNPQLLEYEKIPDHQGRKLRIKTEKDEEKR